MPRLFLHTQTEQNSYSNFFLIFTAPLFTFNVLLLFNLKHQFISVFLLQRFQQILMLPFYTASDTSKLHYFKGQLVQINI